MKLLLTAALFLGLSQSLIAGQLELCLQNVYKYKSEKQNKSPVRYVEYFSHVEMKEGCGDWHNHTRRNVYGNPTSRYQVYKTKIAVSTPQETAAGDVANLSKSTQMVTNKIGSSMDHFTETVNDLPRTLIATEATEAIKSSVISELEARLEDLSREIELLKAK